MEQVASIIGMISGLIAIFSFMTGMTSLPKLNRQPRPSGGGSSLSPSHPRGRFLISIPVFVVSLIITALLGMNGSDSGGIMFFLLVLAAISSFVYVFALHRSVSQVIFALLNIVGLTVVGFAFGSISRGEEATGIIMGMLAGIGVWIVTALGTPRGSQQTDTPR